MKIAFIVEDRYWERHFGVRNYFKTIEGVLSEKHLVDEIIYLNDDGNPGWFKVNLDYFGERESYSITWKVGQEKWTKDYIDSIVKTHNKDEAKPRVYYRPIGDSLLHEKYDVVIITNPWLVQPEMKIDAGEILGIVHDFNANRYSLRAGTSDFMWADRHRKGYDYYNCNCDSVLCNSKATAHDYRLFYPSVDKKRIKELKPFNIYQYRDYPFDESIKRENAIILAAPFDRRKGTDIIPGLISGALGELDMLYIFGEMKCTQKEAAVFFDSLSVNAITYYPYISYKDLACLYNKGKVLLFPSYDEGLGLPIIEAQCYGCRVLTTNKEPMKGLLEEGGAVLSGDNDQDITLLRSMLADSFNNIRLSKAANARFGYKDIIRTITGGC